MKMLLIFVLAAFAGAMSLHAARIDLAEFMPTEAGDEFTLKGTAYLNGKNLPATCKVKTLSVDGYDKTITWRISGDLIAGSHRMISITEDEINARTFRPMRVESHSGKRRTEITYDNWISPVPRVIETGKTYSVGHHFVGPDGGFTVTGYVVYLIDTITTDLGSIECLRVTSDLEKASEKDQRLSRRTHTEEWMARGVGIVRIRSSFFYTDEMLDLDVTVVATSRPVEFRPVVIATR